jgi:hypothetical protein
MHEIRIVGAVLLLLLAGYIAVMNWFCVIVSMRNKRKGINKHHSTVPLMSIIISIAAYALYPLNHKEWIGIIPALDISNWILFIGLPWALMKGTFKNRPGQPPGPNP